MLNKKIGKMIISVAIALALSVALSQTVAFAGEAEGIRAKVLRLHILANSDSAEDQALKIKVRDKILSMEEDLFDKSASLSEVKAKAEKNLPMLLSAAQEEIYKNGYDYSVDAEICEMYFATREYESFTLPAGVYSALRVTIGEGEGKNWWCVLYPPLCLPAAEGSVRADDVFTPSEIDIVENSDKYEFGFAIVEFIEGIKNYFSQ